MPQYDFRCDRCQHRFCLNFRTVASYEAAPLRCPRCESAQVSRRISPVALAKSQRNYRDMSAREMLSVLESGEPRRVNEMFKQVGGGPSPEAPAPDD